MNLKSRLLPDQSWAAMEEKQGALQRAEELRSYRMQNFNEIVLPANFGAGLGIDTPDSPFNTVVNTVRTPLPSCDVSMRKEIVF